MAANPPRPSEAQTDKGARHLSRRIPGGLPAEQRPCWARASQRSSRGV